MKRIVIFTLYILATLSTIAQEQEYIRLTTDKDCYLAGEDLWLKICVSDKNNLPLDISKVAYIEVSDPQQVYAQAKIDLTEGIGNGRIRLPRTMHSGTFQLTAYTRYMRNWGENAYYRQLIAVVNTLQSSKEDQMVWTDSLPKTIELTSEKLATDQKEYPQRSKVSLSWKDVPINAFGLSLSVVRKDYALDPVPFPNLPTYENPTILHSWIPESEGHIINAKAVQENVELRATRLGCVGKDIRLFEGKKEANGSYSYYTHGIYNQQDIAIDAVSKQSTDQARMEIVSPFVNILPKSVPTLHLYSREEALQERSVNMQVRTLLPDSINNSSVMESLYHFTPDISYNLDEWTRFTTVRETLVEFVMGIHVTKRNGETLLQLLREDTKRFSNFKALVLIDGVPVENHEQVLDFDARLLHYIHQYQGGYTFGGQVYEGIISLITHKGTLNGFRLAENSTLLTYEFPQKDKVFLAPVYATDKQKTSRMPDFRHTLYWNPYLNQESGSLEFYTSDVKGTYVVTLTGYTSKGGKWEEKMEFIVP